MQENKSQFKTPSKKHQPDGLSILYEDRELLVVDKTNGLLTMGTDREKEKTAYYRLNNYVKKGNARSRNRIFIVHRLDRETSGVLIFAKTENSKRYLQDNWTDFHKTYLAVVHGILTEKEGLISSYLAENKAHRVYSVKDPGKGKMAKTAYKVLKESSNLSLISIQLLTGRKHQIRVHFSDEGFPVAGDKVYGSSGKDFKRLALHSTSLTIVHPITKKEMTFNTEIPAYFKSLVK